MLAATIFAAPLAAAARPVIVIDPGHGGTNRGAFGPTVKIYEKSLTLRLARLLRQVLRRRLPRAKVLLTRERDRYLTLAQRVAFANAAKADVFVSLHFNASVSRSRSGFETFVLSRRASDREAARLAAKERKRDTRATRSPRRGAVVDDILGDLRQRAMHARSLRLAKAIQLELARVRKAADRGVRQAPFDVLMGLKMPGVLVEAGFIDHVLESRELVKASVQRRIVDGLARGITRFLAPPRRRGRRRVARARSRR